MSPQIHPAGFRISDRPVAASFAHPDSFQPIQEIMLRDEACLTSSLALGGVEGTWVRYWDETSNVAVLEFQVAMPPPPTVQSGKDKKEKKKKGKSRAPLRSSSNNAVQNLLYALSLLLLLLPSLCPTNPSRLVSIKVLPRLVCGCCQ